MLESTEESINKHLYLEVMQYPYKPENWKPTRNIAQAILCLQQMPVWSMEYDGLGSYGVDVNVNTSILHTQLIMAVCTACAIETGWVNDEVHT